MGWFKDFFRFIEEEDKKEYYYVKVFCMNCKKTETVKIVKGKSIKEMLRGLPCSFCGLNYFVPYSLNLEYEEGLIPIEIETLIDWDNVDEKFIKRYENKKEVKNGS